MEEFLESFEAHIEERIQTNYSKLKLIKGYHSANDEFSQKFEYLYCKLESTEDKATLEDMCGLLDEINSKTTYLAYEIGFTDGLKLNNHVKENKN